jgi:hypothetical protein
VRLAVAGRKLPITHDENRYQRMLSEKLPGAWLWMERNDKPLLVQLGRFPRTRRGVQR